MFSFFYMCDIELPNVSKPCHLHFKNCSEYLVVGSVVCNLYFTKRWLVIPISEPTTLVWLWPLAVLYSYYGFWLYPNLDNFCSSLLYISVECLIRVAMPYLFYIMEINPASSLVSKRIRPLITVLCNRTNVSLKNQF